MEPSGKSRHLEDRVAVVTGGAGGIGSASAIALADAGCVVVLLDREQADPVAAARHLSQIEGLRIHGVVASVVDADAVTAAVQAIIEQHGRVDIAVNSAGVADSAGPAASITDAKWDLVLRTHLWGTFHMTRAVLPGMVSNGWGRIVNITSSAAWDPGPGIAAYAAAKAGITGFARSVAAEMGRHGVTVNCLAPGLTATPAVLESWTGDEAIVQAKRLGIRVGPRLGLPEEIAAGVVYLASEAAAFVTGTTIHVNGGSYMS